MNKRVFTEEKLGYAQAAARLKISVTTLRRLVGCRAIMVRVPSPRVHYFLQSDLDEYERRQMENAWPKGRADFSKDPTPPAPMPDSLQASVSTAADKRKRLWYPHAAQHLGVSVATLQRLVHANQIPVYRHKDSEGTIRHYFRRRDLDQYREQKTLNAVPA